jgi:hypothetical protein
LYPIAQHLRDHLLNYYLVEAHNAVDQAQREKLIPEEAEAQVGVIIKVQQFIEQQLGEEFATQLAQIDEMAQKFRPEPPMPPDNSMQVAQINAQVRGQDMQMRAQIEQAKMQQAQQNDAAQLQLEQMKVADAQRARAEAMQSEQLKEAAENQRTMAEIASREKMNTDDNETAKLLAAAEMATGERVAVSTGTGINPNP